MGEVLDKYYYKFESFFNDNPDFVWFLIAIVMIPLGLGAIFGRKWAIDPANSNQRFWYHLLGNKVFGILIGILFLFAGLFCMGIFLSRGNFSIN